MFSLSSDDPRVVPATRRKMMRSIPRKALTSVVAALTVLGAVLVTAIPASGSDWGGYANPANCGSNFLVRESPVYAVGSSTWYKVGTLQIKYSNGCPGNYARYVADSSYMPRSVALSIQAQVSPYNNAGANEEYATVVYTRVIKLARSSDRVCAYLDVRVARPTWMSQYEPVTLTGSAVLCA